MKIFRFLLTIVHLVIFCLLIGTTLNSFITPNVFPYLNFLSLAFPVFLMVHFVLIFIWIIMWKKRAFLFVALTFFLINPMGRWINFNGNDENGTIKLLTFNVKNGSGEHNQKIEDYLNENNFDIISFQESGSKQIKFRNSHQFYSKRGHLAIVSKFPILQSEDILIKKEKGEVGDAAFADIDIKGKKIRLITIYMNSFLVKKENVKPTANLDQNEIKYKTLAGKMRNNFKIHQREIDAILPYIKNSPYPVIVTGDFNAVPNSYEYYQFSKLLKDAFVESGSGSATSFHDFKFPIRIDYIFTSEFIQTNHYKVDRKVNFSDHFPVSVELNLN